VVEEVGKEAVSVAKVVAAATATTAEIQGVAIRTRS